MTFSSAPCAHPVLFVGAGPGDPEMLTLRALRALQEADVVLVDRLISDEIRALIPAHVTQIDVGKTGFGPATPQETINDLLVRHAQQGARVVRLKSGDCTLFGRLDEEIEALEAAQLLFEIVPGLTSASAAVAALGQSLTRRGRNGAVQFVTGHDTRGFADQDWHHLARPGQVTAIYMGIRAARFIQGRLLMHGAQKDTPVSFVENASRPDQSIFSATLATMAETLADAECRGPVLTLLGLAPRQVAARHIPPELAIGTPAALPSYIKEQA